MNPMRVLLFTAAGITAAVATFGFFRPQAQAKPQTPRAIQTPDYQPRYQYSKPEYREEFEHQDGRFSGWED